MKKLHIYILLLASVTLPSCTEWLTVQPQQVLSEDEMFETKDGFYSALYGVYSQLKMNYGHNGGLMTTTIEHMGAQWEVRASSTEERIRNHEYLAAGEYPFANIFSKQFTSIANINNILNFLEIQDFLKEDDYNKLRGECLGLRAWLHFDLVRIWGPIPGHDKATVKYLPYVNEITVSRHIYITYSEYIEQLSQDLAEAERLLTGIELEDNFRLNYMGVWALQTRLSLWLQDNEKALENAEKILAYVGSEENTRYALATLNDVGVKDYRFKKEHLFGIFIDFESSLFPNTTTLYNTTAFLNELYEYSSSDIRMGQWTNRAVQGLDEPAKDILKYLSGSGSVPIVRLSEIYLIAMECGDINRANELYSTFCKSRGLPEITITTKSQLNDIIYKEYRKEFFGEGVMFYYYKRKNTLNIPRNPNRCTEGSYVLALPRKEIDPNS